MIQYFFCYSNSCSLSGCYQQFFTQVFTNEDKAAGTPNEAHPGNTPPPVTIPEVMIDEDTSPRHKPAALKLESSALAAAIVNSAPLYRRQIFLQPSHSFDHAHNSWDSGEDSNLNKRRSWHMERVTARMLSVLEEAGSPISALPAAFGRSFSVESNTSSSKGY